MCILSDNHILDKRKGKLGLEAKIFSYKLKVKIILASACALKKWIYFSLPWTFCDRKNMGWPCLNKDFVHLCVSWDYYAFIFGLQCVWIVLNEWNIYTMVFFNGSMKLKICEALDLKFTDCSLRLGMGGAGKGILSMDPYISVDIDDIHVARTTTKPKTQTPVWNEDFTTEVHNGQTIVLTIFHDAAIPPDEFVANCTVPFEELKGIAKDLWVSIC